MLARRFTNDPNASYNGLSDPMKYAVNYALQMEDRK
jgi:hypothetical protein